MVHPNIIDDGKPIEPNVPETLHYTNNLPIITRER
jgi:hypothetical protein